MVLLKAVQELVVVPQIHHIAVCDGKTSSLNLEFSETVEIPKSAVQRWGGQWTCRDAEVFLSPLKKKKKAWLNLPETPVKSQIACVVKVVLCELRLERKPRSMSSHLHYYLFSSNIFVSYSLKFYPSRFFTISLQIKFSNVLLFSFEFFQMILVVWQKKFCSCWRDILFCFFTVIFFLVLSTFSFFLKLCRL